jgi:hypothetical protein
VNYSGAPLDFPEGEEFSVKSPGAPDIVRWHTGQSGAPDQGTLRLSLALFVEPNSWSFYWLSVNLWHLYNLYNRAKLVSPFICVGQFNHQNQLGNRCKPNSLSGSDTPSVTSKRHERKKFSKIPLRYPRISKRTPLLSVPLGKPPVFDGEDYCMWSDKMRHHLTSLQASIWDIVEFGAQEPSVGDEGYDSDEVA